MRSNSWSLPPTSVLYALLAALLFGASTPVAKALVGDVAPVLLGGLLYLGSGLGLGVYRLWRDRGWRASGLTRSQWPWLLAAIGCGGVLAPVALMVGLTRICAAHASLLLNLESVLTAALAWWVFHEHADRRVMLGMGAIVVGGVVLAWQPGSATPYSWLGIGCIALACLGWALDNNLTRKVAAADAVFIACTKGLLAGVVNSAWALGMGSAMPGLVLGVSTLAVGLLGYGVSLVLFVLALRGLGAARTGAYFSTAPFIGAAIALALLGEPAPPIFWLAALLMALGVWLHLTEHHAHLHQHEPLEHTHAHRHDAHHRHEHLAQDATQTLHQHWHRHEALTHSHPHYPDLHHQHAHDRGAQP